MDKHRRDVLIAGAGLAILTVAAAGCTTTSGASGDPAAQRQSIDSAADSALSRLYAQQPGTKELVASARGMLVFPTFVQAGFIFGGGSGQGVLRRGGKSVSYHRMTEASAGLLAGAQSTAVFILFMTDEALRRFEASNGWTVGADAAVYRRRIRVLFESALSFASSGFRPGGKNRDGMSYIGLLALGSIPAAAAGWTSWNRSSRSARSPSSSWTPTSV
jgi:hypothetical protein